MKRFTYWPQLFLGLTFNWGMIMAYTAILDQITIEIIVFYFSAIFWTLVMTRFMEFKILQMMKLLE